MKCTNCQKEIPDDSKVCPHCNAQVGKTKTRGDILEEEINNLKKTVKELENESKERKAARERRKQQSRTIFDDI